MPYVLSYIPSFVKVLALPTHHQYIFTFNIDSIKKANSKGEKIMKIFVVQPNGYIKRGRILYGSSKRYSIKRFVFFLNWLNQWLTCFPALFLNEEASPNTLKSIGRSFKGSAYGVCPLFLIMRKCSVSRGGISPRESTLYECKCDTRYPIMRKWNFYTERDGKRAVFLLFYSLIQFIHIS